MTFSKTDVLLAEEVAFSSFYTQADYPITKVLREPVYVEVNILERSDPNLVLTLEHCWATSTHSPDSLPQWDLLVDGYIKKNMDLIEFDPVTQNNPQTL